MVTLILLNLISVWFFGNVFLYLVYNHEIVHYIYYKVFSWIGGSNANFGGSGQGAYNPGGGQAPGPGPGGGVNDWVLFGTNGGRHSHFSSDSEDSSHTYFSDASNSSLYISSRDSEEEKKVKFAKFLYNSCLTQNPEVTRGMFDNSGANPINKTFAGSPQNISAGYELIRLILKTEYSDSSSNTSKFYTGFTFNNIGLNHNNPHYGTISSHFQPHMVRGRYFGEDTIFGRRIFTKKLYGLMNSH